MNDRQAQDPVGDMSDIVPEKVEIRDRDEAVARSLKGPAAVAGTVIALLFGSFQLFTAYAGAYPDLIQRSIHMAFAIVLGFLMYAATGTSPRSRPSIIDVLAMFLGLFVCMYAAVNYDRIMMNPGISNRWDLILGVIATGLVLEMTRRILNWILPAIASATILYAFFGPYLPDALAHRGFSVDYILETLYMSTSGLWGTVTGVSATVVAGFLIFGSILYYTGGGEIFVDLAKAIAGRSYGGPAKVSCISSALFGTISGSAVANVVVDGVFNIPLMKRLKYRPEFAAAVEATASTGGQLVPPVMGAGAFIMAELTSTPYLKIALAATIPALLYYVGVASSVHFEARKSGLERIPKELIPSIARTLPKSAPLFIPIGLLIYLLVQGYDPTTSVFWATVASVGFYVLTAGSWAGLRERLWNLVSALEAGGKAMILVACLCACAQIVIGMFNLAGLGIRISEAVIGLSAGSKFLGLFFTMIVCIILGMGLPTTAAYVLAASVTGPALIKLGLSPVAAHLFVFYFAIISAITPPVCAAVFAATAIAKSNWLPTGWLAVRMGMGGFMAPFLFAYCPPLLMAGSPLEIIWNSLVSGLGVMAMAGAVMGYFGDKCRWYEWVLLAAGALLLLKPGLVSDLVGLAVVGIIFGLQKRRQAAAAASLQPAAG
ncbi:MAG: TRAP transporter permease [Desulfobacterales bacterium]|jgi:TRAP transporter 4TM/12TM fusion protein|nr:TRAP transporter permease [Desulfobacterales bacterium]